MFKYYDLFLNIDKTEKSMNNQKAANPYNRAENFL